MITLLVTASCPEDTPRDISRRHVAPLAHYLHMMGFSDMTIGLVVLV